MGDSLEIDPKTFPIAVVGAGSWGTAIADLLACKGFQIHLWVFEKEVRDHIQQFNENKLYLPDHRRDIRGQYRHRPGRDRRQHH